MPFQLRPDLLEWDAETTYPPGLTIIDRGGLWQAQIYHHGTRPIPGTPRWALVGGIPYVELVVPPAQITTAPFYDPTNSGPGLPILPAPGAGLIAWPLWAITTVTPGTAWPSDPEPGLMWGTAAVPQGATPIQATLASALAADLGVNLPSVFCPFGTTGPTSGMSLIPINAPLVVATPVDATNGGMGTGTRALGIRLYYLLAPAFTAV